METMKKKKINLLKKIIYFYLDKNGDNETEGDNFIIVNMLNDLDDELLKISRWWNGVNRFNE